MHFVLIGLSGALIQGRYSCSAQQDLEQNFPTLSAVIGGINWNICCKALGVMQKSMGSVPGFIIGTALMSGIMCIVEQKAAVAGGYMFGHITQEGVPQSKGCCH